MIGRRTLGVLVIYSKETEHDFTEDEVAFLFALASEAAVAIENARPYRTVREQTERIGEAHREALLAKDELMRLLEERKRLEKEIVDTIEKEKKKERMGRDLHDSLGQTLTAVAFRTKALTTKLARGKSAEVPAAQEIVETLNASIAQTRAIARGLYPVELEAKGLVAALRELAGRTQVLFGAACRFDGRVESKIDKGYLATHLYRIAREAVENTVKHSRAKQILIKLERTNGFVLSVMDDGRGFQKNRDATGMGLKTMRYRAELLGAKLKVHSRRPRGTVVTCAIPT
jgi:signal transduction histidine kinase